MTKDRRELYAIHIHGNWCLTCAKIDKVIHETADYFQQRENVEYVVFDETNPESLAKSEVLAKGYGLLDVFEHERHTGELLFVDKKTKEVLTKWYGVGSKEKYIQATEDLLAGKDVESILAKKRDYELSKPTKEIIEKAKLYIVDIHHDMCGGCAITAPVFEAVAKDYLKNEEVCFFTFDLTTPETVDQTRELAQALDIEEIYNNQKHTGEVLFIDAKKKEILKTLILEEDSNRYQEIISELKKLV